jgi:thioredoxin-related protein
MRQILLSMFIIFSLTACSQNTKPTIYNPLADAQADLQQAVSQAKAERKHVLIQVGGNWCPWCIKLHKFIHENAQIDSIIKADYVFILINYSKENKNPEMMKQLEYPQRFGFPVLVVVDQAGNRIHTQDTGLLEDSDGYSAEKIKGFLLNWNVKALNPEKYN